MPKFVNPTTSDLFAPTEERVIEKATGVKQRGALANPTLDDLGVERKNEILAPDFAGNTLQIGPFDTKLPISPRTAQFLSGAGRSYASTGRAVKQLTGNLPPAEADRLREIDQALIDTGAGTAGDIFGSTVQTAPLAVGKLAGGLSSLVKMAGAKRLAPKIAQSLLADAGLSGALFSQMRPMGSDESRVGQAALGATGAIAGHAVMAPVFKTAGKIVNTVRNKWGDERAQMLDRLARENGVELSAGDATNSPTWRNFEDMTKDIPGTGRRSNMERQTGQIQDMLYSLREDMRPDLRVPGTPDMYATPEDMMVGEIKRNHAQLIKQKDALFDNVNTVMANNPAATKVDLSKTEKAVQDLLADYPTIFNNFKDVDAPLVNKVKGLAGDLGELGRSKTTGKFSQKADYNEAQWLRKRLGALTAQAEKQSKSGSVGAVTDDAAGQLKQVYKAVNQDLDAWGAGVKNKEIHDAYKTAQDFYKENIVPFKRNDVLKKVVDEFKPFDSDVAKDAFFKKDRGNLAKSIMKFQTPEGKAAAQFVIMDDVLNSALDTNKASGLDITKFLNQSKKLDVPSREVYSPELQKRMADAEEIIRAASRSDDYMNSNVGVARNMAMRSIPYVGAIGGAGAMAAGAGALPLVLGGGALLGGAHALNAAGSNPLGKRILMSSNKLPGPLQALAEFTSTRTGGPTALTKLENAGGLEQLIDQNRAMELDPMSY